MKLVVQRVSKAEVAIEGKICGSIQKGLLVLLGIHQKDTKAHVDWCVNKLVNLRIFSDTQGKMNLSVKDVNGEVLLVSQFTLYGNCSNGRRPDFLEAAPPSLAQPLYEYFIDQLKKEVKNVQTGEFGGIMQVSLTNEGPVTMIIEK